MQAIRPALLSILLLAACAPSPASDPTRLAAAVAEAARDRDYETLSRHMAEEFSYSFGMPRSREGALERFQQQPELLGKMAEVLEQECTSKTIANAAWYICPSAAADESIQYYGWRAGFRQKENGTWEFVWFIAGD